MQPGIHVIERTRLPALAARGVQVPEPRIGLLDLARTVEGFLPEPTPRQPMVVVGLDALLLAGGGDGAVLQPVRRSLHEAKRYFVVKQIPLVFLTAGRLDGHLDAEGLVVVQGAERFRLSALLGTGLAPMLKDEPGWWWSPQIG